MPGTASSGRHAEGIRARDLLLSLLEIHTEGASATELGSYIGRDPNTAKEHLVNMSKTGKVHQTPDKLWHLTEPEAEHRASLTPATVLNFPLPSARVRNR